MSTIFVNGLSAKTGGGKAILNNLLTLLKENSPRDRYVVNVFKKMTNSSEQELLNMAKVSKQMAIERFSPENVIKSFFNRLGKL